MMSDDKTAITIPARVIAAPAHLSAIAKAYLTPTAPPGDYPPLED